MFLHPADAGVLKKRVVSDGQGVTGGADPVRCAERKSMAPSERSLNGSAAIDVLNQPLGEAEDGREYLSLDELARGAERVGGMMVRSTQVRKMLATLARLGPYKSTVLIQGESGTGKELVARALHALGPTPNGPFVTFNCCNLVESLAESHLFGHIRGTLNDASDESIGYFRSANGGTLFLDEIAELPLKLQPKLLRAVETHEVQPLGSSQSYRVDIRLVASTNRDLRAMVRAGQFRDDLYYRLNAAAILVPPLRERREAIPAFIAYFIEHYNRLFGKEIARVDKRAVQMLSNYSWPGNVRELANAIEVAALMTDGDVLAHEDLPPHLSDAGLRGEALDALGMDGIESDAEFTDVQHPYSLSAAIHRASKSALTRALEAASGNCYRAANLLGVSRYTVYRMLNRYGMAESRGYRGARKSPPNGRPN
jgi:two-component system, NtrC family, response regulator AtoC